MPWLWTSHPQKSILLSSLVIQESWLFNFLEQQLSSLSRWSEKSPLLCLRKVEGSNRTEGSCISKQVIEWCCPGNRRVCVTTKMAEALLIHYSVEWCCTLAMVMGTKIPQLLILYIKDIVIQRDGKLSSSSQILMVHSWGCTAVGISKFLSHARALTHM